MGCVELQYDGILKGVQLQYRGIKADSLRHWAGANDTFIVLDWMFGSLFIMEAGLKLCTLRVQYFQDHWKWLDFFTSGVFVLDKIATALSSTILNSQTIRLLRLFRLIRLVRLIGSMTHLEMLYIMVTAIRGMGMIVVWAVTLLTLLLMICALFLSQYLHSTYFSEAEDSTQQMSEFELSRYHKIYEYFGTFTRCMLSMFEMSLGNWPPVARLLGEEVSEAFAVLCIFHKVIIGLAVVGVINGVILRETFRVVQTDDLVMLRQKKKRKNCDET